MLLCVVIKIYVKDWRPEAIHIDNYLLANYVETLELYEIIILFIFGNIFLFLCQDFFLKKKGGARIKDGRFIWFHLILVKKTMMTKMIGLYLYRKKQAIMESSSSNRIVFKFIQIFFLIIGIIQFEHFFFVVDNSLTQV